MTNQPVTSVTDNALPVTLVTAGAGRPEDDAVFMRERCEAAMQMISDLCQGRRNWMMSIPAQPDYDPDLVISAALADIPKLLEALGE